MLQHKVRVDPGVMARKGTPHSPKLKHYWILTIRLFSVISRTLVGEVLPLCMGKTCLLRYRKCRETLSDDQIDSFVTSLKLHLNWHMKNVLLNWLVSWLVLQHVNPCWVTLYQSQFNNLWSWIVYSIKMYLPNHFKQVNNSCSQTDLFNL